MSCFNKLPIHDLIAGLFYLSMIFVITTKRTSAIPIAVPEGWRTNLESFRLMEFKFFRENWLEDPKFIYGKSKFFLSISKI